MWTIIFPTRLYDSLKRLLFSTSPNENGCFLLAGWYERSKSKSMLMVTEILAPCGTSWNTDGPHSLEPSSTFINEAAVRADTQNSSVIFVHTHPHPMHPARFSSIDERSNKRLFANLAQILPNRPLASLVFTKNSICGVVHSKSRLEPLSFIKLVGHTMAAMPAVGFKARKHRSNPMFDRQLRLLGKERHTKLQDLSVTIVGAGGTGSSVAVQLARVGVKRLRLVDCDVIDASNVSRVYGSKVRDVGKPKAEVVKRHIENFSKTKVIAVCADVTTDDITTELIDSDVLFACTDNLGSRAVLNDISVQYYIPLVDVGCRISIKKDGELDQAVAKVQLVSPDDACLWCTGTLDGKLILQESLPFEEKRRLAKEGYYQEIGDQPSIVSMTTMAASMGVNKLLSMLGVFGHDFASRTQIELKTGFMNEDTPEIKQNCICRIRRGLGHRRRILNFDEVPIRSFANLIPSKEERKCPTPMTT